MYATRTTPCTNLEILAKELENHEQQKLKKHKSKKRRKKSAVSANISSCRFELVKRTIEEFGMIISKEETSIGSTSNLIWSDCGVQHDRIQDLKNYQRINHFPNMGEICRKDSLARNMSKMRRACGEEYNFTPRAWVVPSEYNTLLQYTQNYRKSKKRNPIFIYKPSNGAMGNGIHLFRNPEKIHMSDQQRVVQEYLNKPLLWDGYKIDLRIYVLITHCDPLRAFLYQDGLVRLSTEKYSPACDDNLDQLYMHLTNYSVNKYNENFERHQDLDRGSKRSIKSLMKHLSHSGHDTTKLWRNISDLVVKTLIVASPQVTHGYRMCRPGQSPLSDSVCFEILGFDIFLDKKLKPWLLEVNRAPSFGGDERIDREIKTGVITDALTLINLKASDKKRNLASQKAETRKRLFGTHPNHHQYNYQEMDGTKFVKNQIAINRRKKELKDRLAWVRKDAIREEFEDENIGNYIRIFPCIDSVQRKKYTCLLSHAFKLFHHIQSFQKNFVEYYNPKREDEILQLIEECEEEEGIKPQNKKQLSSMPQLMTKSQTSMTSSNSSYSYTSDDSDATDDEHKIDVNKITRKRYSVFDKPRINVIPPPTAATNKSTKSSSIIRRRTPNKSPDYMKNNKQTEKSNKRSSIQQHQQQENIGDVSSRIINKLIDEHQYNIHTNIIQDTTPTILISMKEREQDNLQWTLDALQRTKIKFPGKTDDEAAMLLHYLLENWSEHKPKIAHYWLVQLDTSKRKKVIEIVQGNVRAVVERVWKWSKVNTQKLNRLFNRVFNRMQWNRGQGLWNCFINDSDSWETILSKSSEQVNELELQCCRRIVQLCKDCLLVVYQFANESKTPGITSRMTSQKKRMQLTTSSCEQR